VEEVSIEWVQEEEESSKEVQDLDKTSLAKEQAHNDEMNKSYLFGPFRNS
jgi:hypothetical protein